MSEFEILPGVGFNSPWAPGGWSSDTQHTRFHNYWKVFERWKSVIFIWTGLIQYSTWLSDVNQRLTHNTHFYFNHNFQSKLKLMQLIKGPLWSFWPLASAFTCESLFHTWTWTHMHTDDSPFSHLFHTEAVTEPCLPSHLGLHDADTLKRCNQESSTPVKRNLCVRGETLCSGRF